MQQSRCGGVFYAIRIRCASYPTRHAFFEFINRFRLLAPEALGRSFDENKVCAKILEKMGLSGFQIGKTKVFLRVGQMVELDARRSEVLGNAATTIQRRIRTHVAHQHVTTMRKASIFLQSFCRVALLPIVYRSLKHSVKFTSHNFACSSLYRKYLEELCVWVESNTTMLSILYSQYEIRVAV